MNTELSSKYDPSTVEAQAYQVWLDEKCFHADPSKPGESFCIVIPPPNVTGALHLGHAINNTLQDILTRQHRMAGFNTLWVPGIDHAGIATQAVVEKQLKEQENKTRHDVGREGLVERIWTWKQQYGDRILSQLKRMGCSCDWDRTRFTLDDMCAKAVRETFFKLFKDGLIYRGKRLVNWDTFLQTSISDDEIYHETVKTSLWHIRYPIAELEGRRDGETEGQRDRGTESHESAPSLSPSVSPSLHLSVPPSLPTHMIVATTRPETMLGDTAVAVHSDDPRWNWAIGKHVRLPLTNRLIPIIADDILVDPKFGTGVVKVTPAHDPNDYAVWQRHKGQADEIDLINILTPDGKITSDRAEWSKYAGMKRMDARKMVVADLTAAGLLEKEEPYETQVGHSDRSKTPVEPYLSDQWFVKMAPLAEPALEVVRNGKVKFHPERHAQQYLSWLGEKRDWPVSRQLWWGHRIPVWSGPATLNDKGFIEQVVPSWSGSAADEVRRGDVQYGTSISPDNPWHTWTRAIRDEATGQWHLWNCVAPGHPEEEAELEKRGYSQDPDVLDTWFSSALWPHSTLGWPEKTPELAKYYPTSVLLTARDIITLWVARMVMTGLYNMGDIPFAHVYINPTILDGKGARMSKSEGNGVDPVDIIHSHGADALRFTLTNMATETQDSRMPVQVVCPHCEERLPNPEGKAPEMTCAKCKKKLTRPVGSASGTADAPLARMTSEKFDQGRNFCNKLWNACRFALSNLESVGSASADALGGTTASATASAKADPTLTLADRWIIGRFNRAMTEADDALKNYRFDVYAKACYDFFWRDFCDWYVEAIKPAMKDPARAPQTASVLAAVLDGSLRLMHPMIPFITETVWWRLNDVRPVRGLPGLLECPPSKRLVLAQWPKAQIGDSDDSAAIFPRLQEIISSIRTIRNDYQVNPKQTVPVSIKSPPDFTGQIESNRELIELLGTCALKAVQSDLAPPQNSVTATSGGCDLFVEGLIDPNAEKARLTKEIEAKKKSIEGMKSRLGNESYVAKAPPKVVQQTRDQLVAVEAEVGKMEEALRKLG